MTRKDTIIIAVLVNAALLIALFVTAIKRDSSKVEGEKIAANIQPITIPETDKKEIKAAQGDEIDLVLKEFSEKKGEVVANTEESQKIDFVKELEAITRSVSELPTETISPADDFVKVTVKKGDVLEKIARTNHTSVDEIMRVNQLKSSMLQIGQTLKIPKKAGAQAVERAVVTSGGGEEFYVVKQGDNPWAIAVKNHLKVDELLKLNNLTEEKARHLKPGDKLRIRK